MKQQHSLSNKASGTRMPTEVALVLCNQIFRILDASMSK